MSKNQNGKKQQMFCLTAFACHDTTKRRLYQPILSLLNSLTFIFKMTPTGSIFFNVAQTFLIWRKWWRKKKNIQGNPACEQLILHADIHNLRQYLRKFHVLLAITFKNLKIFKCMQETYLFQYNLDGLQHSGTPR